MKYLLIFFLSFSVQAQNLGDIDPDYDTTKYDYMYKNNNETYICETLTRTMHGGYLLIDCEHTLSRNKVPEMIPDHDSILTLVPDNTKG